MLHLPTAIVDVSERTALRGGIQFTLTEQETVLLQYLARQDRPVSRDELLERVWGYAKGVRTRAVDATVSRLRTKIEDTPKHPACLLSVRGLGYRLVTLTGEPSPPSRDFVGRSTERRRLSDLSMRGGPVQIIGPGGAGKTRLAREFLSGTSGTFVDLTGVTNLVEVPITIARALDVRLAHAETIEQLQQMARMLSREPRVVVLDNLEQFPAEITTLIETLCAGSAAVTVLLTSRLVLSDSWPRIDVGPLDLASAQHLLERTARRHHPHWTPPRRLDSLLDAVDRLPLAIELVSARLPLLGTDAVLATLSRISSANDGRHGSLLATVAWTWSLLEPVDQRCLAWWSVFKGPMSIEALDGVRPDPEIPASNTVERLDRACLLDTRQGIRPWVGVREYAALHLDQLGERAAAEQAHARWFVDRVAEEPTADWIAAHQEDLRAAAGRERSRTPTHACRLLLALLSIDHRLSADDLADLVCTTLEVADAAGLDELSLEGRIAAVECTSRSFDLALIEQHLTQAERLLGSETSPILRSRYHAARGTLLRRQGEFDDALAAFHQARRLIEGHVEHRRLAVLEHDIGATHRRAGRPGRARHHLMSGASSDPDGYTAALCFQALAAIARIRDPEQAVDYGERAVAAGRRAGDPYALGGALTNHGNVHYTLGHLDRAEELHREAVDILSSSGFEVTLSYALGNLGSTLDALGRHTDAELQLHRAASVASDAGIPHVGAFWTLRLAFIAQRRGWLELADEQYSAAIRTLDAHNLRPQNLHGKSMHATLVAERGQLQRARELLLSASDLQEGVQEDQVTYGIAKAVVDLLAGESPEGCAQRVASHLEVARSTPTLNDLAVLWDRVLAVRAPSSRR